MKMVDFICAGCGISTRTSAYEIANNIARCGMCGHHVNPSDIAEHTTDDLIVNFQNNHDYGKHVTEIIFNNIMQYMGFLHESTQGKLSKETEEAMITVNNKCMSNIMKELEIMLRSFTPERVMSFQKDWKKLVEKEM